MSAQAEASATALGDLADDALLAVFLQLTTRAMARKMSVCHRWSRVIAATADVRATALGMCLAPYRGTARVELLSIKETVARGLRGFNDDEDEAVVPRHQYGISTRIDEPTANDSRALFLMVGLS